MGSSRGRGVARMFKGFDPLAVDLLEKLLVYDPRNRLTVEEVLKHEYLKDFHKESDEIECKNKIVLKIDDNDKCSLSIYRGAIYANISDNIKEQTQKFDDNKLKNIKILKRKKPNR